MYSLMAYFSRQKWNSSGQEKLIRCRFVQWHCGRWAVILTKTKSQNIKHCEVKHFPVFTPLASVWYGQRVPLTSLWSSLSYKTVSALAQASYSLQLQQEKLKSFNSPKELKHSQLKPLATSNSYQTQAVANIATSFNNFSLPLNLRVLKSCKYKLEKDLTDKLGALEVDTTCATLTDQTPGIGYTKTDAIQIQTK